MAELMDKYKQEVTPKIMEKFGFESPMRAPRLKKIVINMGIGMGAQNKKLVEDAVKELAAIAGQKPVICKARKSVAGFKVRTGNAIGCKVTLRRARMYEFLNRFISVAVPRIRDFRGFPTNSFDRNGNYTFGLNEQTIFPEVNLDKVKRTQGMDITIVTSAGNAEEARELLNLLGFPFRKIQEGVQ